MAASVSRFPDACTMLEFPADDGAFQLFDSRCHGHPLLPRLDCRIAILKQVVQHFAGKVRVECDLKDLEALAQLTENVFHGAEVHDVAGGTAENYRQGPMRFAEIVIPHASSKNVPIEVHQIVRKRRLRSSPWP